MLQLLATSAFQPAPHLLVYSISLWQLGGLYQQLLYPAAGLGAAPRGVGEIYKVLPLSSRTGVNSVVALTPCACHAPWHGRAQPALIAVRGPSLVAAGCMHAGLVASPSRGAEAQCSEVRHPRCVPCWFRCTLARIASLVGSACMH